MGCTGQDTASLRFQLPPELLGTLWHDCSCDSATASSTPSAKINSHSWCCLGPCLVPPQFTVELFFGFVNCWTAVLLWC